MADPEIVKVVQVYLAAVRRSGLDANRAVLFGSCARGETQPDRDVDILVIAPEFDEPYDKSRIDLLWALRAQTDSRIEPVAVGEHQWQEDAGSLLLEMARHKGLVILPMAASGRGKVNGCSRPTGLTVAEFLDALEVSP